MDEIRVADDAGIRTVTFDRPAKKNALTTAMYAALADAVESAENAHDVGAIVFAGAGGDYTAGHDLRDFLAFDGAMEDAPVMRFLRALATTSVPLIAAVRGRAIGVGATMLLHCDFVYASASAKLTLPFVDIGLVPEAASTLLLRRAIGHRRTCEVMLLGKSLGAAEALDLGLVNEVCADGELLERAYATARVLVAKPRAALRSTIRLLKADAASVVARMDVESSELTRLLRTSEARSAFEAILKR